MCSKANYEAINKEIENTDWTKDKAGIKIKAAMGEIQIYAKGKKEKRAKQVVANKSGLSADHIIYELENKKLQTVLKEAKLHYEEKVGRPNKKIITDSGTTLDTLPNHRHKLVILPLKEKTSQIIKIKQTC